MNLEAKVVQYISIDYFATMPDKVHIAETKCLDYTHFTNLPNVIKLNGIFLGKSGWNSDRQVVYYRSDKVTAEIIST